ncbi:MAG TPA: hypothetical protein VIG50_14975 [Vicinamibacteria bacterium]|jgi:hypothetical protein
MSHEMESLNLDDLDVEGLEHRLEMAAATGAMAGCDTDICVQDCRQNCNANITWMCG